MKAFTALLACRSGFRLGVAVVQRDRHKRRARLQQRLSLDFQRFRCVQQDSPKRDSGGFLGLYKPFEKAQILFSFALVGVGLLQYLVYRNQAQIMSAQTKVMANQADQTAISLRAYVVPKISTTQTTEPVTNGADWWITEVDLLNQGLTETKKLRWNYSEITNPTVDPNASNFDYPLGPNRYGSLFAKQSRRID